MFKAINESFEKKFQDILIPQTSTKKSLRESLSKKKVLQEGTYRGAKRVNFIGHGSWSDPELEYDGYIFNYWDIEDALWGDFLEETGYADSQSEDPKVEREYNQYVQSNVEGYLQDCIAGGAFTRLEIEGDVMEFPNGDYFYVNYKNGKISLNTALNTGSVPEYEIDYDFDNSIDANLQALYDSAVEKSPFLVTDATLGESKSLKEAPVYDMTPQYDSRKSFYNKARVDDNGNEKTLYSYNTPVAKIVDGKVELLPKWDWSQTTLRHVKEFLKQNGFEAGSVSQMRQTYL